MRFSRFFLQTKFSADGSFEARCGSANRSTFNRLIRKKLHASGKYSVLTTLRRKVRLTPVEKGALSASLRASFARLLRQTWPISCKRRNAQKRRGARSCAQ